MYSKFLCLLATLLLFWGCAKDECDPPTPKTSILLDSDMVEAFDDGVTFMMLLGSENVEVKGLTTVTGNSWAQEGLTYGIRLGELCGGDNLTYIAGASRPMREGRLDELSVQVNANPGHDAGYLGALSHEEVDDWERFYEERYGRKPRLHPSSKDAPEYIAQQILAAPGQVTLVVIGPCTNIAKALVAHPEIAAKAKEIIYMGGAVYCEGNTTPYAEMNFLFDPEAAAICLRAPFPKQTLVCLDVCNTVKMDSRRFMGFYNSIRSEEIKSLFRNNYTYRRFEADPSVLQLVWDVISGAVAIDPAIITEYRDVRLDVDDDPASPTYGKVYETSLPSCRTVRVPTAINQEKLWGMVSATLSKL